MRAVRNIVIVALAVVGFLVGVASCQKVPAGHVGVKVYLLGTSKGVDHEVLGVGRYWIGINEELYLFPTFQQNYVWTYSDGSADESITFQTKEGMSVNVDIGISYHLDPEHIAAIFQKYRRGIDEITDIYLRNAVRDTINEIASTMSVEEVYGLKKAELFDNVQAKVSEQMNPEGIMIDKIYLIGSARLPDNVVAALNAKIEATQRAQQRENEVQEAKAQAAKEVAKAEGEAKAMLLRAEAEAKSNQLRRQSLTQELIKYEAILKWDGKLPQYTGGGPLPFIEVK